MWFPLLLCGPSFGFEDFNEARRLDLVGTPASGGFEQKNDTPVFLVWQIFVIDEAGPLPGLDEEGHRDALRHKGRQAEYPRCAGFEIQGFPADFSSQSNPRGIEYAKAVCGEFPRAGIDEVNLKLPAALGIYLVGGENQDSFLQA